MASSCRSSSSLVSRSSWRCHCGDQPILLTSNSNANPGRKFWRCPNWNTLNSCNFFNWADKKEKSDNISADLSHSAISSDGLHEESRRKIVKLKKKLDAERRKSNVLLLATVVSWAVTVFTLLYCISGRG